MRLRSGCAALAAALLVAFSLPSIAFGSSEPNASPASVHAARAPGSKAKKPKLSGKKKKKRKKKTRTRAKPKAPVGVAAETSLGVGILRGVGVRKVTAPMLEVRARIDPFARFGRFELKSPVSFMQRTPFGVSLQETRGFGKLAAEYAPFPVLRIDGSVGAVAVLRPNWPDLYQPRADGSLVPTDRFSYFERVLTVGVTLGRPAFRGRAEYAYSLSDYRDDPSFEPIERPNHIPPGDHDEHQARLSLRGGARSLKLGGSVLVEQRSYFYQFARDAETGKTHAGPGGPPPNPLLRTVKVEPALELRWSPSKSFVLKPVLACAVMTDTFEGYFSYTAPRPSVEVEWSPTSLLRIAAEVESESRRYGPDSYAAGPDHPALDYGDRRMDERLRATLTMSYRVATSWDFVLAAHGVRRRTNFPSYVPYVYPAEQPYDIDWDYDNASVVFGVRHTFSSD